MADDDNTPSPGQLGQFERQQGWLPEQSTTTTTTGSPEPSVNEPPSVQNGQEVKPMTMGRQAQIQSFQSGQYVLIDGKLYNRRDGKLYQVTGGEKGEVEQSPEEAAKILQASSPSATATNTYPPPVISEEEEATAKQSLLPGGMALGASLIENMSQIAGGGKGLALGALKSAGTAFAPYTFNKLRGEIQKVQPRGVLVIGDNDPAPPLERLTKPELAQEQMAMGLGSAGLFSPLGPSATASAFSAGANGWGWARSLYPYTIQPYVREGQIKEVQEGIDRFNRYAVEVRKSNEVKVD